MLKMSKNSIFALNSVLLSQIYLILVTHVSEVTHEIAPVRSFVRPSVRPSNFLRNGSSDFSDFLYDVSHL